MSKILAVLLALCAFAAIAIAKEEFYSDKYDYIDVEAILNNDRIRKQYFDCFMDLAPCLTADAKYTRDILTDIMVTKCRKCSDKQKVKLDKIVNFFAEKHPDELRQLIKHIIERTKTKK